MVEPEPQMRRLLPELPQCHRDGDKKLWQSREKEASPSVVQPDTLAQPPGTVLPRSGLVSLPCGSECGWPRRLCHRWCRALVLGAL